MEKSSGEQVFQSILLSVREKKGVPDEEIRDFSRKVAELLENPKCSVLPEVYKALNEEVELYEEVDLPAMSELYHVFSIGQLRGATRLVDEIRRCVRLSEITEKDLQDYLSKYHVFKLTEQQPGITDKELARKSDMKISNLTHFMKRAESDGYFHSWRSGRNKYYHLGKKGEILLEKMEELKAAEQDISIKEQS